MDVLKGHTSPEAAYVVEDYPYGFRLRCRIRYWLEYKSGCGYRLVSQTTNPKATGEVWNKPKRSTYTELAVMVLLPENDKGVREVSWAGLNRYTIGEKLEEFVQAYQAGFGDREWGLVQGYRNAILRREDLSKPL